MSTQENVDRALAAEVDAQLDVWEGMVHGFLGSVGHMSGSTQVLRQIGSFLSERFSKTTAKRQTYRGTNREQR